MERVRDGERGEGENDGRSYNELHLLDECRGYIESKRVPCTPAHGRQPAHTIVNSEATPQKRDHDNRLHPVGN